MRLRLGKFSRYRPRALTLVVLVVSAAPLVLANLCCNVLEMEPVSILEGGWPLNWYTHSVRGPFSPVLWQFTPIRLAADALVWLVLLAVPVAACEWLSRRYRPRPSWSVRAIFILVAFVAVLCGLYAAARKRASFQDSLIAAIKVRESTDAANFRWSVPARVWIDRTGPEWFELAGIDSLCRKIVGVDLGSRANFEYDDECDGDVEGLLRRFADLSDLRYLFIEVNQLTPGMCETLRRMRRLQMLSIEVNEVTGDLASLPADLPELRILSISANHLANDKPLRSEYLSAIAQMTSLRTLHLRSMSIESECLAHLSSLRNLESLILDDMSDEDASDGAPLLLAQLPALPRLEMVNVNGSIVAREDLRCLAALPRLKVLSLAGIYFGSDDLAQLASCELLEDLTIGFNSLTNADGMDDLPGGLEALTAVKNLRQLHLQYGGFGQRVIALQLDGGDAVDVPSSKLDLFRRALQSLRGAQPGIVIDTKADGLRWPGRQMIPPRYAPLPGPLRAWAFEFL